MQSDLNPSDYQLLCVDDEPNILSSLRRMLMVEGFQVQTASSGEEALSLMRAQSFDLIISDMHMPKMNGAELLSRVRQEFPQTMRLLLTGMADVSSAIAAVNHGEIYRYLTKPWNDGELLTAIRSALDVLKHNQARETRLRASYVTAIKLCSTLMELRRPDLLAHSRRVAQLARRIARHAGFDEEQVQMVYIAGLLHDIGKIGLSDRILDTKFVELPLADVDVYKRHSEVGQRCLSIIDELEGIGQIVRSHHEYHNGSGFPDGLAGEEIVIGARILGLAEAFDGLVSGDYGKASPSFQHALKIIAGNRGKLFDPQMTDHFLAVMAEH